MAYTYIKTQDGFTVGTAGPDDAWCPESDHSTADEAAARVAWLNGGGPPPATGLSHEIGVLKSFPLRSSPTDTSPIVQLSLSIADWQNLGSQLGIHLSSVQRGRCWGNPELTLWLHRAITAQVSSQTLALEALEEIQQAVIDHHGEPLLVMEKLNAVLEKAGYSFGGDY